MKNRIIFSLAFILFFYSSFQPILASWYSGYTGWNSRMNVTINNTGNSNLLTNYQIWMNISYRSGMDSNFNDLRFTYYNSGQETPIPYWVERNVTGQFVETWVNVTSIPANDYATIYMYYGNPSASSESNGTNTCIEFNDFEDGNVPSSWYAYSTGSLSVDTVGYQGSKSLKYTAGASLPRGEYRTFATSYNSGRVIIYVKCNAENDGAGFYLLSGTGFTVRAYTSFNVGTSWQRGEVHWTGAGGGSLSGSASSGGSSSSLTWTGSGNVQGSIFPYNDISHPYWNDVFCLAKYVSPEPTFRMKAESVGTFCCQLSPSTPQKKCWTSGICCLQGTTGEYWDLTGCRDFTVWVQPNRIMFPIGTRNFVILYVENKGGYTDNYTVNYEKKPNDPNIIVDLTGVTPTDNVASGEIIRLYPGITVLTTITDGYVTFMVNSNNEPTMQRNATLNIMESDFPLSLPEFDLLGLIEILILVGLVYFFSFISFKSRKISAV